MSIEELEAVVAGLQTQKQITLIQLRYIESSLAAATINLIAARNDRAPPSPPARRAG